MPEKDAYSELAVFGEELRRERETRGISLKEIADATKVSRRFLEAIERNDHKTLPAPVFTRGFVREYARYLGLNADDVVSRYNYGAAGDNRIEQSAHLERLTHIAQDTPPAQPAEPRPRRDIPTPLARIDRSIYGFVIVVAALTGLIYWAILHKRQPALEGFVSKRASAVPVSRPVPAAVPPPAEPAQAAASAVADSELHLVVDLAADSWIALEVDGKTVISDELKRGDRRLFDAKSEFRFRTVGNAAGVRLTLNGVRLPSMGEDGEVVHDRFYNRATLQQVTNQLPRTES